MRYSWARDYALALIDQYSVAGCEVAPSYNNQADYLKKLPRLLDDAQVLAATTSRRLRATVELRELPRSRLGEWEVYTLLEDCWRMRGGGLLRLGPEGAGRYGDYRLLDEKRLALPARAGQDLLVEYFRWPRLLGEDPQEDAELDNTVEVQMALPFYAAAHLAMHDSAFAYASLMNEFESRLAAPEPLEVERGLIGDSYSGEEEDEG